MRGADRGARRLARRARLLALLGLLAAGPATGAAAQEAGRPSDADPPARDAARITLLEALDRARATHPSVQAAEADAASARAAAGRVAADRWPDLSLRASATQYQEPMIVHPIHAFDPGATPPFDETLLDAGAYLDYTLLDFGARSARIRGARLGATAAAAGRVAAGQALLADVAGAYLDVLGLRRELEAHDRRIAALEAERSRVERLRAVGRAARVELLRVEASLAAARSDREERRARLVVAEGDLARLTGLPARRIAADRLVPVAYAGPGLPPAAALAARAVARNPSVARARREREASRAAVDVARAARRPDLKLGGAWVDRGSGSGDFRAEWSLGVGLSVPLFTGGRIGGQIEEARAGATAAEQRLRLAELAVERAVDRACASVSETSARVASLERAVAAREEVARIERLRLEAGAGTQTEYLDAEAELLASRASLARMRFAALQARVELARATGELDRGWIDRNLEDGS